MPVSLHTHSWYSLLEATASPATLLRRAARCGYRALALTDTNNLYGAMNFVEEAKNWGIRPLLGACLRQQRTRAVALMADSTGYASLCRILSRLHLTEEPLVELLVSSARGLHLLVDDLDLADQLRDAYPGRLWIEVARPASNARQETTLLDGARQRGLPLIASTAAHLADPTEYPAFRVGVAVERNILLEQLPDHLALTPAHHLIEAPVWPLRFPDLPEAVSNTDRLAEQLQHDVLPRATILPQPRTPRDWGAVKFLRLLCERGLTLRGLAGSELARRRLQQELAVLDHGNLPGYFLIVRRIARYARNKGLSMALRGSAGNCLVCYLLEITDVDPLRFQLPLERFLHPGRLDLPDIDLDFDWKTRDQVIEWVFQRHGARHTAMISTHLCLQPRSAFREAAKVHGLSGVQVSRLLETFAERMEGMLTGGGELPRAPASFPLEPERWPRLLADARRLLGRPHHLSIHPGGVVITPGPIEECSLQMAPKGVVITQFEKDAAEYVGLVKIDLLGNRALSSVDAATALLKQHVPFAVRDRPAWLKSSATPPDGDQATVALLQRGDTLGVNQLESPAMRRLLIQMRPTDLLDVVQALAMIRPGAASVGMKEVFIRRRLRLESVRTVHPKLAEVLKETEGLMVFEDDALRVVQALTGLGPTEADHFRKRITKHRTVEEARVLTLEFLTACNRNGISRPAAEEIWVQLAKFNSYSFCKSHAVSYGLIAWKASYLKAHYPACQWTAALNNNQGMYARRVYVEAIKRDGLRLTLPCINRSADDFAVEDGQIRTGLEAIGGLDEAFRQRLLADRLARGPYLSLADLRRRIDPGPETLSLLIRIREPLDCLGESRPALFLRGRVAGVGPRETVDTLHRRSRSAMGSARLCDRTPLAR